MNTAQYENLNIVYQSMAIDESNQNKYVFYVDGNGGGFVRTYDKVNDNWMQIETTFNLIGTAQPKYPSIIAKDGTIVIGFYDGLSNQYYVYKNDGGGFNIVDAPISNPSADDASFTKLAFNGNFEDCFLLRRYNAVAYSINISKIDVTIGSVEDFGDIPFVGQNPIGPSNPDIFISNSEVFVLCEEYMDGPGYDLCKVEKCAIGNPFNWGTHATIGQDLDEFNMTGDHNDLPYIAYEDLNNAFIKLDKLSTANYDNISQLAIAGPGISGLSLAWNSADETFISYKDLSNNKIWVKKNELGTLNNYGLGDFGNYTDYNLTNLVYDETLSSLNMAFTVPDGYPVTGGHVTYINDAPTAVKSNEILYCENGSAGQAFDVVINDINKDSTYVYSIVSLNQSIVADVAITFDNSNTIHLSPTKTVPVNLASVLAGGTVSFQVGISDGIDSNIQTFSYTVNSLPTVTIFADPINLCEDASAYDLNTNVSPLGGTWTIGSSFDPGPLGPGNFTRDYTYTDGNGCESTETQNLTVNMLPTISFTLSPVKICPGSPDYDLTSLATPSGGVFTDGAIVSSAIEPPGTSFSRTYEYTDGNGCSNTGDIDIEMLQETVITFAETPLNLCQNGPTENLSNYVTPNTGTYQAGASFDPSIEAIGPHTKTYEVTDSDGCIFSEDLEIEVHAPPTISFTDENVQLCNNADLYNLTNNVVTSGNGHYLSNTTYFNPLNYSPGASVDRVYQAYDALSGCINRDTMTIEILGIPNVTSAITNADCGINNGSIDLTYSSPNGPSVVYWNTGQTIDDLIDLEPGTYYANVTDAAGCSSFIQSDVTSNEIMLSANITNPTCHDSNDGSIDLTVTGSNGPFLFLWATADSTEDISNLAHGSYFVTVTDNAGCITTASYEVNAPAPLLFDAAITESPCSLSDGSIIISNTTGGSGNYSHYWSDGIGTGTSANNIPGGIYEYVLSDDNNCSTDTAYLTIDESNTPVITILEVIHTDCNDMNGQISIDINIPNSEIASILWSNGMTTKTINGLEEGIYNVTVTNTTGCSAYASVDLQIEAPLVNDICVVTVDSATTTNLVAWERAETSGIDHYNIYRENATAGHYVKIDEVDADSLSQYVDLAASPTVKSWRYKLTATNECGVEGPKSPRHKTIHVVYEANGSDYNVFWDPYEGFDVSTYVIGRIDAINTEWVQLGTVNAGNQLTIVDTPPVTDGLDYRIFVDVLGGCQATKANDYNSSRSNRSAGTFNPGDIGTPDVGLTELELSYNVSIYPNPTTSNVSINVDNGTIIKTVEIRNVNGQIIYNENLNGFSSEINLSAFESGIYFVLVTTDQGKSIHKVIKK